MGAQGETGCLQSKIGAVRIRIGVWGLGFWRLGFWVVLYAITLVRRGYRCSLAVYQGAPGIQAIIIIPAFVVGTTISLCLGLGGPGLSTDPQTVRSQTHENRRISTLTQGTTHLDPRSPNPQTHNTEAGPKLGKTSQGHHVALVRGTHDT